MKTLSKVIISAVVLITVLSAAKSAVFIPAFDNLGTGYAKSYNKFMSEQTDLPNGYKLIVRPDTTAESAYNNLADLSEGSRYAIIADVVSAKVGFIRTKLMFVFRYVDLTSGGVIFSRLKAGRAWFGSKEKRGNRAAKKAAKKFIKMDPKIPDDYEFNGRKVGFVMVPPSGISKQTLGRGLEAVVGNMVSRDPRFNLIERRILEQQLKEQSLSLSGIIQSGDVPEVGKIATLEYGLRYEVADIIHVAHKMGNRDRYLHVTTIPVVFQVIRMKTAETKFLEQFSYKGYNINSSENQDLVSLGMALVRTVGNARKYMTRYVRHSFSLPGKEKDQVLAFGKEEGMEGGRYKLFRKKEIKDPFTDEVIGYDEKKVGKVSLSDLEAHQAKASLSFKEEGTDYTGFTFRKR